MTTTKRWIAVFVLFTALGVQSDRAVHAASFMSDKGMAILCFQHDAETRAGCRLYIQGVVETLFLVNEASRLGKGTINPNLTLCEKAVLQEWDLIVQVVRSNVKSMQSGFAVFEIRNALHNLFCDGKN